MRNSVANPEFRFALPGTCEPIDLDSYMKPAGTPRRNEYLCQVLLRLRKHLAGMPLRFYVTDSWQELPSYGRNVFAILRDCGAYYFPAYLDQVGGVFKVHPVVPYTSFGSGSLRLEFSTALRFLRDMAQWGNSYMRYRMRHRAKRNIDSFNVYSIPLGYGRQKDLEIDLAKPREFDLSFTGSVASGASSGFSLKATIGSPKTLSRTRMIAAVKDMQRRRPDIRVALRLTDTFRESLADDGSEYSRSLATSKIALVPRGDVSESFRYFEALRYGCVVVCEPQPPVWFYEGSPAVVIRNWDQLGDTVSVLLDTPGKIAQLQQDSVKFWHRVCSEEAVAKFMADIISTIVQRDM